MNDSGRLTPRALPRAATLIGILLVISHGASADVYQCIFRGQNFDNDVLAPLNAGTVKLMRPQRDGLVMNVPAGEKLPAVGVRPAFSVKGDFEITASFTLPKPRFPKGGYGAGATLYLATHSDTSASASIGRLLRTDKKNVYSTNIASTVDEERQQQVKLFPAEERSGKLQLIRTGTTLKFLVADGTDGEFQEVRESEFVSDDVKLVRLGVQQSDAETPVEVVWHEINIRADELPGRPDESNLEEKRYNPTYVPAPEPERLSLWWSVAAGMALIALLATVVWYRRNH